MANLLGRYSQAQLKDAQQLLDLYQQRESVREFIKNRLNEKKAVSWKGRALIFYCQLFSQVAQSQVNLLAQDQPRLGEKYKKQYNEAKKDPKQFTTFLSNYIEDERKHHLFKNTITNWEKEGLKPIVNPIIPDEIDRMPEGPEKFKKTEAFVFQADKEIEKEEQKQVGDKKQVEVPENIIDTKQPEGTTQAVREAIPTKTEAPITNAPRTFPSLALRERLGPLILKVKQLKAPSFVKDLSTNAQITAKKFISRFPKEIPGGLAGTVGGLVWGGPPGAVIGAIAGVVAAKVVGNTIIQESPLFKPYQESRSVELSDYVLPSGRRLLSIAGGSENPGEFQTPINTPPPMNKKSSRINLEKLGWLRTGPIVIAAISLIFIFALFILLMTGDGGGGLINLNPTQPPGKPGQISSCTFYRGGDTTPGLKFRIQEWPTLINDIASKVGVPAPILAGILRVECGSCFNTSDPTYVTNDYDSHCSKDSSGNCIAYGAMQFTPGAFLNTFNNNQEEMKNKFSKTSVSLEIKDQNNIDPNTVLRLYSIKDTMIAAAFKVRADAGSNPPFSQSTVENIAYRYYGCLKYDVPPKDDSCSNGAYNYGADLWNSYNNCQIPSLPVDGNYKQWIFDNFGININDGFAPEVYQWAAEVLNLSTTTAPKFKELLTGSLIEVKPVCDVISNVSGRTIFLRNRIQFCPGATKDGPTNNERLFKQNLIHELGHIVNGSYRPGIYGSQIGDVITDEGYLTKYSASAATADDQICGEGNADTRASEDFSESVSYFIIGEKIEEQNYGCGINLNQNPIYTQAGGRLLFPKHYQLMNNLLK